VAFYLFFKK